MEMNSRYPMSKLSPEAKPMEMLSGAEMVVRSLIDQGVKHVFGYPGGAVLDIYDALHTVGGIDHVLVRHEQGAVHMADGYARATGEVGVVLVTSGPGATNAITGIATAYMDSVPMVVLSGQVPSSLIGFDAFQECDMVGISRPVVKHSFLVKRTEDIPMVLKKAFYLASTGRPGPVVIDLPKDIVGPAVKMPYAYPEQVSLRSYNPTVQGHRGQIKRALQTIMAAKRPIMYVGGGAINAACHEELLILAEKLNLPVTSSLMGLGSFPGTHRQSVGMLGMHGTFEANMAMHNTDLIFAVGVRFDDRTTNNLAKYCPDATVLHIDIDPTSISKTVTADIPIVGDAKQVLTQMLDLLSQVGCTQDFDSLRDWWQSIEQWRTRNCLGYNKDSGKIKPQAVIEALHRLTKGDAYVTSDVGQHQMFAALYYPFDKPRRWINSGGLGTMGFGLPAALGVKLALPNETVVCVTGDGSIQMNIQELSTALQYNLPVLVLNLNNRYLGMVKQWQDMIYSGRHSQSYMDSLPDFVKLAEAYGHIGVAINTPDELESKLADALTQLSETNRLVFVDVTVDETEHVYPMQIRGGGMDEMWLSKTERT
ncbi:acetolactate synthase, large subunit, biosynthetic type [Yersinia pestis biovar Antiqua str. B42003004]|uniref:Acetolactate synthase n=25 Tax=Yersinia pseudotuberculosis complex TaxID=1649845 RepID=Q8CZQ3_YERPE|nr:acetolactate synthase III, large subunit [Yersinia pestis KIM10+]AAS63794.1 acetolactate synthase isozyme III large subunit [Yersinia pestis biovar Microtus str. 91001]ABX88215.1 acetolactate synthase, large subunit, biosynthetic type [Yersinia pestis Angola]EDR32853.1 acetolactate synthase, large subunit, biosynthetic type [Yersinia pestis biovar Orientalis str. IP275]EDR37128.1 acetolactate synthase, large subunit, biosynthetic type [Yersinia pestis biovar Orientalis str. F1991016]EDR4457